MAHFESPERLAQGNPDWAIVPCHLAPTRQLNLVRKASIYSCIINATHSIGYESFLEQARIGTGFVDTPIRYANFPPYLANHVWYINI